MTEYNKSGIYKITSPSGRIYIGQSVSIRRRYLYYRNNKCKSQPKLYHSIIKYGFDNHIFEILEECSKEDLSKRERHWQEFYNVLNNGLNCILTNCEDKKLVLSAETIKKKSESMIGSKNSFYGKKHSEEAKQKNREAHIGNIPSLESNEKRSLALKGRKGNLHTLESKQKRSSDQKGGGNNIARLVLCLTTGIFYDCAKDAAEAYSINVKTLRHWLSGERKNKSNLIYI